MTDAPDPDCFVALEGAHNFRDAGGQILGDGARVRRGRLFRSDSLHRLSDADHQALATLDVATVYDLREDRERTRAPTRWQGPELRSGPDPEGHVPWSSLLSGETPDADGAARFLNGLYAKLPGFPAPRLGEIIRTLAADGGAVLIHCSAGKDRTGVAIAVLLGLLGVPREAIAADYVLSSHRMGMAANQRAAFERTEVSAMLPADAVDVLHSARAEFFVDGARGDRCRLWYA